MRFFRPSTLLCAAAVVCLQAGVEAAPQSPDGVPAPSLTRLKQRLGKPPAKPLKPAEPVQLRPVFRTRTIDRPFVPTLEEHLRETFELTDFQRQYAKYTAANGGFDLSLLFGKIDRALDERKQRKVREHVTQELAFVEAAQAKQLR